MSQEEILELLNKRELTRAEMQELTGLCSAAIVNALRQLLKYDEIEKDYSKRKPVYKLKKKRKGDPHPPSK